MKVSKMMPWKTVIGFVVAAASVVGVSALHAAAASAAGVPNTLDCQGHASYSINPNHDGQNYWRFADNMLGIPDPTAPPNPAGCVEAVPDESYVPTPPNPTDLVGSPLSVFGYLAYASGAVPVANGGDVYLSSHGNLVCGTGTLQGVDGSSVQTFVGTGLDITVLSNWSVSFSNGSGTVIGTATTYYDDGSGRPAVTKPLSGTIVIENNPPLSSCSANDGNTYVHLQW